MSLQIIVDTREKEPYTFYGEDVELHHQKLDTADYTLVGFEDRLAIERKKSVSEISQNLISSRFTKELKRMTEIPHSFIVCEFSLQQLIDFPVGANLPPKVFKKIKISGKFLLRRICELMTEFSNVKVLFCDNRYLAEEITLSILKRFA